MKSALITAAIVTTLVGVVLVNQTPDFLTLIIRLTIAIVLLLIFLIPVRRKYWGPNAMNSIWKAVVVGVALGIGAVLSHELILRLISRGVE